MVKQISEGMLNFKPRRSSEYRQVPRKHLEVLAGRRRLRRPPCSLPGRIHSPPPPAPLCSAQPACAVSRSSEQAVRSKTVLPRSYVRIPFHCGSGGDLSYSSGSLQVTLTLELGLPSSTTQTGNHGDSPLGPSALLDTLNLPCPHGLCRTFLNLLGRRLSLLFPNIFTECFQHSS